MTTSGFLSQILGASSDDGDPAILDGALAAFLDFGIKRTSMGEIAKRSGVSPATLYRRYASKTAVVEAVGLREAQRFVTAVDGRVDRSAPVEVQVATGFSAFVAILSGNPLLRRLLITEPDVLLPYLTTNGGPLLALGRAYLADYIGELQGNAELREFDTEQVAEILARLALSLALTPDGIIPVEDEKAAQEFALAHIATLLRIPST